MTYKLMPRCVLDWKEALFMGYFGPIGIGAVFYVEHTRHLFPEPGEAFTTEENNLTRAMIPVVYWLVLFSIFWHGLSIPALNMIYTWRGVQPVQDEDGPALVQRLSMHNPAPKNSTLDEKRGTVLLNNRFSRNYNTADFNPTVIEESRRRTQLWYQSRDVEALAEKQKQDLPSVSFAQAPHYRPNISQPQMNSSF
jgi:hypothetical protein